MRDGMGTTVVTLGEEEREGGSEEVKKRKLKGDKERMCTCEERKEGE